MTCVVTDGKIVAADGQASRDGLIVTQTQMKLFHAHDGSVVGCAGDTSANALVREWFEKGEDNENIPVLRGADFVGLVLRPDGRVQLIDKLFTPFDCDSPQAVGSGDNIALGAMMAGADPKRAVEIVAQLCTTVGGKISTLKPKAKPDADA